VQVAERDHACEACAADGSYKPALDFDTLCAAHRTAYDANPDEADRIQGLIFDALIAAVGADGDHAADGATERPWVRPE
jgi:hypothetical protein